MSATTFNHEPQAAAPTNPTATVPSGKELYKKLQNRLLNGRIVFILPPNVSIVHIVYILDGMCVNYRITGIEFKK